MTAWAIMATVLGCTLLPAPATAQNSAPERVAVAVGISLYEDDQGIGKLRFADRDAKHFGDHASSGRGGNIVAPALSLLTDQQATITVLQNDIKSALRNARAGSEVYLFISGRGFSAPGWGEGYIYASNSREEKRSSALSVSDLRQWIEETHAAHVFLFADVQRSLSRSPGAPVENRINLVLQGLREVHGPIVEGLLATGEEDPAAHYGVFSSNLFKALQGQAPDSANSNRVTFASVWDYIRKNAAGSGQNGMGPSLFGNTKAGGNLVLSDLTRPGANLRAAFPRWAALLAFLQEPGQNPGATQGSAAERFDRALTEGRLQGPGSAEEIARSLGASLPQASRQRLALALEDRGEQVIIRYGTGDQFPVDETRRDLLRLKREQFLVARDQFRAARNWRSAGLAPDNPEFAFLEARELLCDGQARLFEPFDVSGAIAALDRARELAPRLAEAHNARGVAAMRAFRYPAAISFFRKASALEPDWAYPRHNAALAEIELGDYRAGRNRLSRGDHADALLSVPVLQSRPLAAPVEPQNCGRSAVSSRGRFV